MALINPPLPDLGQPNLTEDADIRSALQAILNLVNGQLDASNLVDGAVVLAKLAAAVQESLVKPGVCVATLADVADAGYVLGDDSIYPRTGPYAALFARIGTKFNHGGEAGTEFRVPDLRGRLLIGKGTHVDINDLTKNDGLALGSRTPKRTANTSVAGAHVHSLLTGAPNSTGLAVLYDAVGSSIGVAKSDHLHGGATVNDGTGNHQHTVPTDPGGFQVVNWQIKL